MVLFKNVKKYFLAKLENDSIETTPEGVCPNCWGKQEWDGEFYKRIKAKNITPDQNTYTNFIHEVVEKLDKITLKEDLYTCETCNINNQEK